ncbi:MAG: DUF3341 domain-containing protein [Phycisphaerales bacterium]
MSTLVTTPRESAGGAGSPGNRRIYGVIAEFETPGALMKAAEQVRKAGYRWWDCCTPFPVHGLDKAMGIRPTALPWFVFGAGATGTSIGFLLQSFTNSTDFSIWALVKVTGYPFLISGKPLLSLQAFIPVMFELTILLAATSCFGLMFLFNGLPRHSHPLLGNDRFRRVTNDRFFVVIEARDPRYRAGKTEEFLKSLGPVAVEAVEEEPCPA